MATHPVGTIDFLNGVITQTNPQGQVSLVKQGALIGEGDALTLLSGQAYVHMLSGLSRDLSLGKTFFVDGQSPLINPQEHPTILEELIQVAIQAGINPAEVLELLGPAGAGEENITLAQTQSNIQMARESHDLAQTEVKISLSEGGLEASAVDPLYSLGHLGGPFSLLNSLGAPREELFEYVYGETDKGHEGLGLPKTIFYATSREEPEFSFNTQTSDRPSITSPTPSSEKIMVDESQLGLSASNNFAGNFTIGQSGGAVSSPVYALHFDPNNTQTNLVDTLSNETIVLSYNNGSIEGRTINGQDLVFTLSVDNTGEVSLTQWRSIVHGDSNNPDEAIGLSNAQQITLSATITDGQGNSSSASLDLSSALGFKDDGPAIIALATDAMMVDETSLNVSTSADFSNNFISSFGADLGGGINYALAIKSVGVATGLSDSATGQAINLFMKGASVEGRVGTSSGPLVFTVTVDASGNVSLTQLRAVVHTDSGSADESVTLSASDLIKLTATITDSEGDSASAFINIGQSLNFKDDGPTISALATEAITVDETSLNLSASSDFSDNFSHSFGADAGGSVSYDLAIKSAGAATGLSDTATGQSINLYMNGTTVEGRAGNSSGPLVFTVTVDASGNVALTQLRAVVHTDSGSADESTSLNAADLVKLTATITDSEGDSASAFINIGQSLTFKDDGPTINALATEAIIVDETSLNLSASSDFSDNFNHSFGADAGGSVSYDLAIKSVGAATGLSDTATGQSINLYMNGTTVEGRVGNSSGPLVFTVTVDASGNVALTQLRAVVHTDSGSADESTSLNAADLVKLTATITDSEGDSASAFINIGQSLTFKDDGPTISALATEAITVDETSLNLSASSDFSDNFSHSFGADAGGSVSYDLAIKAVGAATGLSDSATGQSINLYMNGTMVEGRVGNSSGPLVFTVTVDASGNVALTQLRAVVHTDSGSADESTSLNAADLVKLTATITDSEGDTNSAFINIGQSLTFKDDGPTINALATEGITVDETSLNLSASSDFSDNFSHSFGADAGGSVSYNLAIKSAGAATGLSDSATGQSINLYMNGTTVEGRVGNSSGPLVFTVTVDASGNVALTQLRAVVHTDSGSADEPTSLNAADLVKLTATITDSEGDSASAFINIGQSLTFKDDGPTINALATEAITVDETSLNLSASSDFSDNFSHSFGADAGGSVSYDLAIKAVGAATGLSDTATGQSINLYMNGTTVEGRAGTSSGPLVFTVTVDASGNVALTQMRAVVHTDSGSADEPTSLNAADLVKLTATITDSEGDSASAFINIGKSLTFKDDGPTINALATEAITVDETSLNVSASSDFSDNFSHSFGADAGGSVSYDLAIKSVGAATGLSDTATGQSINLYMNGATVEGRAGNSSGPVVFTVTVDASGNVALTQLRAIVHTDSGSADESTSLNAADLVKLTATITDSEGDSASAFINIGQSLTFKDDGPTINALATEAIIVDETSLNLSASSDFSDNFNHSFGADAGGSVSYDLVIKSIGAATGLSDSATGQSINLYMNGTTVEGRAGTSSGPVVFTVTVDASGNVALTQLRAVVHTDSGSADESTSLNAADLVKLTATITDSEGDSASAFINIGQSLTFKDDGPTINALATEAITVDETSLNVSASSDFSDNFSHSFGADAGGSVSYDLAIKAVGAATGLSDTATGQAINLYMNGATVEGRVGNSSGPLVFTVTVDASGNVALTQLRAVVHTDSGSADEFTSLNAADLVKLTATITDSEGDSNSAFINIGQSLTFKDDGPTISALATEAITVDETSLNVSASSDFSDNFSHSFGADAGGSVSYDLAIKSVGAATGLSDSATGQSINLYMNGTTVEGRAGNSSGPVVFTVTVDASGNVALTQLRAIVHTDSGSADESTSLNAADLVKLTATITDSEGDSASAFINIGQSLTFKDDGPTINALATEAITVDETNLNVSASSDFSDNFSRSFGADAGGSVTYNLAIKAVGVASGLNDSATGQAINLYMNGTTVEGRVGTSSGPLAFTVTVNASGNVALTQMRAVVHTNSASADESTTLTAADLVKLTATITDSEGDSASAFINIGQSLTFKDDGPTINALATEAITVDETSLNVSASSDFSDNFSRSFGADAGGSVTYNLAIKAVGVASGLNDSATGQAINLYMNGTTVEGRVGTSSGPLAFTVTVNASGNVALTQMRAVVHTNSASADESTTLTAADLVKLTATITDSEGDSASAFINIGQSLTFKDDGPTINALATEAITVDETSLNVSASSDFSDNFSRSFGADAGGSVTYNLAIKAVGVASGLSDSATGQSINLYMNGATVEGRVGTSSGPVVFTVTVNGAGNVSLTQMRAIVHTNSASADESTSLNAADLVKLTATITDSEGDSASAFINIGQSLTFKDDGPTISALPTDTITVDETSLNVSASSNFSDNFNRSFGADAGGSVTYNLAIKAVGVASGLNDSATGNAINLYMNGTTVEGRVGTSTGPLAFTVTVNAAGNVSLTQMRAVIHTNAASADESTSLTAADLIKLTATITDSEGDSASAFINIGQGLIFKDDGPTISALATDFIMVDETNLNLSASSDFSNNFISSFGADTGGSINYALAIKTVGVASGLNDTATGQAINLYMNGTTVEGRVGSVGGPLAFTVTVNASGNVSLTQMRAVIHTNAASADESTSLTAADLIKLTATITDSDGDSASAFINIGQGLIFKDDGPTINALATEAITVDETSLNVSASSDFSDNFSRSFGADAGGSVTYNLAIKAVGAATGLSDSATGQAINLYMNGTTVEGRAGTSSGPVVFTVTVNGAGSVSLMQMRAIVHTNSASADESTTLTAADLVKLTATITDSEGDSASAFINIGQSLTFKDDGPTISALPTDTITVDETSLNVSASSNFSDNFNRSFGADAGSSVNYALAIKSVGVASGLVDIATGQSINLYMNGSTVEGRVGTAVGALAFTVTVNGAGNVTLTQVRAVLHPVISSNDESITLSAADLIKLTATITDSEGDSASAFINIGQGLNFKDDGPSVIVPTTASLLNNSGATVTVALDTDTNIDNNAGADGFFSINSITFANVTDGMLSGFKSSGANIRLYLNATDNILTGSTASTEAGVTAGNTIFKVTLQPDNSAALSTDTYKVEMFGSVDGQSKSFNDLTGTSGGNLRSKIVSSPDNAVQILLTPKDISNPADLTGGTISSSTTQIGISNSWIDAGTGDSEVLRMDFGLFHYTGSNFVVDNHYNVNGFKFAFVDVGGSASQTVAVNLKAFDANNDTNLINDSVDTISRIIVYGTDGTTVLADATSFFNSGGITITFNGINGVNITGMKEGYSIATYTGSGFNRIEIDNISTAQGSADQFAVGLISAESVNSGPVSMNFDIKLTDRDGDTLTIDDAIKINLNPVVAPIVLDLNHDGFNFVAHDQVPFSFGFDFYNTGEVRTPAWIGPTEALLVYDANLDRLLTDVREFVFADASKGANTDLEGLRINYDTNHDGILNSNDTGFSHFGVWQDLNSNGFMDVGEFSYLSEKSIASINLTSDNNEYFAANGEVKVFGESTFTYFDGSTGKLADAAFGTYEKQAEEKTDNAAEQSLNPGDQEAHEDASLALFNDSDSHQLNIGENLQESGHMSGSQGLDVLKFNESGMSLDANEIKEHFSGQFEQVDMQGQGDNTISLDFDAVLSLSEGSKLNLEFNNHEEAVSVLKIHTDVGDTVNLDHAKDVTADVKQGQLEAGDKVFQVSNADNSQNAYVHIVGAPIVQVEAPMPPPPTAVHG